MEFLTAVFARDFSLLADNECELLDKSSSEDSIWPSLPVLPNMLCECIQLEFLELVSLDFSMWKLHDLPRVDLQVTQCHFYSIMLITNNLCQHTSN